MEVEFNRYKLSCELRGHTDDVRGICVCENAGIATSSQDKTVRFWSQDPSDKRNYTSSKIFLGHLSFVGPLTWISPNQEFPEGRIVSGGMDKLILVWNVSTGERVQTLQGHQRQVTGLVFDAYKEEIVSSSVDCTVRWWSKGQVRHTLDAHSELAVLAFIQLPSGEFVSGSSDNTIKLWEASKCVHTFVGHTDIVRSLAVMPGMGFLSASHDRSIRLWALTGQELQKMVGHTSIVYSVDSHHSGLIVSGSEDRTAKIWRDESCVQSIEHPGCVWDAKFLENGDIVTACSDGVVRVWTSNQDRIADETNLEHYNSQLSEYKLSRKRVGGLKLVELPSLDALQTPGNTDGQKKLIREGDSGVEYSWNLRENRWDKIGEVVDDGAGKQILDGTEYDFVFDVDVREAEEIRFPSSQNIIRKLPYNRSDDVHDTVDKWLRKEWLRLIYHNEIVEFIQTAGQTSTPLKLSFRDPNMDANLYQPGETYNTAGTSSASSSKIAQMTWEAENNVVAVDDAVFRYDEAWHSKLQYEEPWIPDPIYIRAVSISAVALLKMVNHCKSHKNEVMGMIVGKLEASTIVVMDVFELAVEGVEDGVNLQADPSYDDIVDNSQTNEKVGRYERIVGWYHSHPGYGCWLSSADVATQMKNQMHQDPSIAIVIDPTRTASAGKVEIQAYRMFPEEHIQPKQNPQGLNKPTVGRHPEPADVRVPVEKYQDFEKNHKKYYCLDITYFKSPLDKHLLESLWKDYWIHTLSFSPFSGHYIAEQQISDIAEKLSVAEIALKRSSESGLDEESKKGLVSDSVRMTKMAARESSKLTAEQVLDVTSKVMKMVFQVGGPPVLAAAEEPNDEEHDSDSEELSDQMA